MTEDNLKKMNYIENRAYSNLNADKARKGSKGFFAECFGDLRRYVEYGGQDPMELTLIDTDFSHCRFHASDGNAYPLFYEVERKPLSEVRAFETYEEMKKNLIIGEEVEALSEEATFMLTGFRKSAGGELEIYLNGNKVTPSQFLNQFVRTSGSPCGILEIIN